MATSATLISGWIKKYKWIAWAGLIAILIVAIATVIIRFRNSRYLKIDTSKSNEL